MTHLEIFRSVYGHSRNFHTPIRLKIQGNDEHVCELSEGKGIFNPKIYGVTVVSKQNNTWKRNEDDSTVFYTLKEAQNYIDTLLSYV